MDTSKSHAFYVSLKNLCTGFVQTFITFKFYIFEGAGIQVQVY